MNTPLTSLSTTTVSRFSTCLFVATLCLGSSAFAGCLDVKWFGATGDGIHDDTDAIQAAIKSTIGLAQPAVCFPSGKYRLTHALRPDMVDNLTLQGAPGATLIADPDMTTWPGNAFP